MEKYAIFLDIDCTLLPYGKPVPPENIRAIKEATEAGHHVFINTGRAFSCIPGYIKQNVPLSGYVAGCGANIIFKNEVIKSVILTPEELKFSWKIIENSGVMCLYEGENLCIAHGEESLTVWKEHADGNIIYSPEEFDTKFASARISKLTVMPVPAEDAVRKLAENFDIINMSFYMEVIPKGCSKGNGMLEIAEKLGIKRENCIAMGDSENDRTMLETAGISVAMDNSPDEIKKIADFVSTDCQDGGVAYAIDKLVLKK